MPDMGLLDLRMSLKPLSVGPDVEVTTIQSILGKSWLNWRENNILDTDNARNVNLSSNPTNLKAVGATFS